ncbi:MAG: OadG family protein [Bacteroidaceae bacterium]|nr:OadG family protein [Bacteroidaceae bacterium]
MKLSNKLIILVVALLALLPMGALADGLQSLRLSEVGLGDGSEDNPAWIEIQNTSYGSQNLGGFYITNNPAALNKDLTAPQRIKMMHLIPTGNPITKITPQNCIVLYADGNDNLGLQHMNFTLQAGDIVALFSGNGIDLMDSLTIPEDIVAGKSWAKNFEKDTWRVCDRPSPTQANDYEQAKKNNKIAEFKEKDPYGIAMAIMAMGVVFSCLLLLYLFFKFFGKLFVRMDSGEKPTALADTSKTKASAGDDAATVAAIMAVTEATAGTGDEDLDVALIALALQAELAHDEESGVITIIPSASPWADKAEMIAAGMMK